MTAFFVLFLCFFAKTCMIFFRKTKLYAPRSTVMDIKKDDLLINPPKQFRPISLWAWNTRLYKEETARQLDAINALGTDGIVINFTGFDLNSLLQDEEKTAAETARQGAFFNLLTEWKAAHAGKEIVFKGSPQNVIGKEILVESKYIIVNAHSAKNLYEMSYLVLMASAKGVPTDRFIIGVTTPYLSNMGDQYGMVNGRSAIVAAAEWTLQEVPDYIKAGISVDGVEQDYFNPTKIYPNVREAINILSPTAK